MKVWDGEYGVEPLGSRVVDGSIDTVLWITPQD
jgi:hypothetical protein